jgi:hypothetical protein
MSTVKLFYLYALNENEDQQIIAAGGGNSLLVARW